MPIKEMERNESWKNKTPLIKSGVLFQFITPLDLLQKHFACSLVHQENEL
jgi:hypothetical protein